MRLLLISLLTTALAACGSTGWSRDPTPEYLAVRPQVVHVVEVIGARDDMDAVVRAELVKQLVELEYRVAEPYEPADADVRFFVEGLKHGRDWYDGVASAEMNVRIEVRGPTGTLYESSSRGWRGEDPADLDEFEEREDRDLEDVLWDAAIDPVVDSAFPPDYEKMLRDAARQAARGALSHFPARMEPVSGPSSAK